MVWWGVYWGRGQRVGWGSGSFGSIIQKENPWGPDSGQERTGQD